MEARVGIGRLDRRFGDKMAQVAALLKRNVSLLAPTSADWLADVFADSQRSVPDMSRFVTPAWTLRMMP